MNKFIKVHNERGDAVRINTDYVDTYQALPEQFAPCKSTISYADSEDFIWVTETVGEIDKMVGLS